VACPNCWHFFFPEDVLFRARHTDLVGDTVAGQDEYLRFLPRRFNAAGEALDPRGMPTTDLACPRCHLPVAEALLEVPPLFISLIGSPASGKSYFLTTMTWELRRLMPTARMAFSDADPEANSAIHEYEHTLFMNPQPDVPTDIRKTQSADPKLYRTALIDGAAIRYPKPLQFRLWPTADHPRSANSHRIGRIIILYDNAGEDFLPGAEEHSAASVQHLARSQILFALLDPTQDPRFRSACRSDDPQLVHGLRPDMDPRSVILRQETLLQEAAVKIRRYLRISEKQRISKPLIVIVPKYDVWQDLVGATVSREPYDDEDESPLALRMGQVERTSETIRDLLCRLCPEFVTTAEGLSENVLYIPVSSLGRSPELIQHAERRFYGIRPKDIRPCWVTVPLLYCLCKWAPGMIQSDVPPE